MAERNHLGRHMRLFTDKSTPRTYLASMVVNLHVYGPDSRPDVKQAPKRAMFWPLITKYLPQRQVLITLEIILLTTISEI